MRLDAFLSELLYEHDCVIIPGFGGLVANYRSAKWYSRTHQVVPPGKHVGFNRNLTQNDGLLAHFISNITGWSYDQSVNAVNECVKEYQQVLSEGKRVVWDKIGFLFRDRSGNLQFIPSENENFLVSSFGLQTLQLIPVSAPQQKEEPKIVHLPAAAHRRRGSKTWLTAAAISIPIVVASALLLNDQLNHDGQLGLNPFASRIISSDYAVRSSEMEWPVNENTVSLSDFISDSTTALHYNFSTDALDNDGIKIVVKSPEPVIAPTPTKVSNKKYAIIGGAFAIEENADRLVAQLREKGFDAERVGKSKGLFLVAIGSYSNVIDARTALNDIRTKENLKAWMKKIR